MQLTAPLRPKEHAEQALVAAILGGTFPPGTSLPGERTLAAQLGVTRPTLREAIQRLERDGWLTVSQGRTTTVNNYWEEGGLNVLGALVTHSDQLPPDFICQLLEVRLQLAPAYMSLAVAAHSQDVVAFLEQGRTLPDTPQAFAAFDWHLHRNLTIWSGNPIYSMILNGFAGFYERVATHYFNSSESRSASRRFYGQLRPVAASGNEVAAAELAREMMMKSIALWEAQQGARAAVAREGSMRRWNGWGDDTVDYKLPAGAGAFLEEVVGPAEPPIDADLADVLRSVPVARLPAHDLVNMEPAWRLSHARGQSLPDWVAMRTGMVETFPDGVAQPIDDKQVLSLLAYASAVGAKVIPYGGGTSVVGHINPLPGDAPLLTMNLRYLNRLKRLEPTSRLATFAGGISGPELEGQLRAAGYTLGHFPQSFELSTLGGWIATRSSGQQSLRYGRIEDLFAGGTVLSPAGTTHLPPFPASAAGPDLRQLILGSEGRLGIITEAVVRIRPLPDLEEFHAIFFPNFEAGLVAVRTAVQADIPLSMLRLSTAVETETTLALAGHERLIGMLEALLTVRSVAEDKAMLMCGFTGTQSHVRATRHRMLEIAKDYGGVHVGRRFGDQWAASRFRTPYLRNTLWERGYAVDTLETATTWEQVPRTMAALHATLRDGLVECGERVHAFSHLSHVYRDGASIYVTYLFRLANSGPETLRRWETLKSAASHAIVEHGGTISHQHGVGLDHRPYLAAEKGDLGIQALEDVAARFDPAHMMNPGKLVG